MVDNLLILIHHFCSKHFFNICDFEIIFLTPCISLGCFKEEQLVKIRQNIESFIYSYA